MMEGGRYSFASSPVSQERPRLPDNVKKIDLTTIPHLYFDVCPLFLKEMTHEDSTNRNTGESLQSRCGLG